jgi:hypothetical protein
MSRRKASAADATAFETRRQAVDAAEARAGEYANQARHA